MNIEIELTDVPDDVTGFVVHIGVERPEDAQDAYDRGYRAALAEHHPHPDADERKRFEAAAEREHADARDELETENPIREHDDQHGGDLDAALRGGNTGAPPDRAPREADPMPETPLGYTMFHDDTSRHDRDDSTGPAHRSGAESDWNESRNDGA